MTELSRALELPRKINLWGYLVMKLAGRSVVAKDNRRSRLFYNVISRLYDWLIVVKIYGYMHSARRLVEEVVESDDIVVDLGCGTGLVAHLAAQRAKEVLGVDHAIKMLERAKRKSKHLRNVRYVLGDCRSLPLAGGFDVVLSSFMLVILNVREREEVIRDAYRLLRPGGKIGLLGSQDRMSNEWYTPTAWRQLLGRAGFEEVKILDLNEAFRIVSARRPVDS